ncbi:ATP-binding protein [soil metagenome]
MNCDYQLIIIRGTPGSGKSSLGRRLKKVFPNGVLIELDNVRGMMNDVDWNSDEQHFIALEVAASAVNTFISSKRNPVIVVDMFLPDMLKFFLEKIPKTDYKIITLLVNSETLAKRFTVRKEGFRDIEKGITLNKLILDHPANDETKIDTSEIEKNEVAEKCLSALRN